MSSFEEEFEILKTEFVKFHKDEIFVLFDKDPVKFLKMMKQIFMIQLKLLTLHFALTQI